MAIAALATLVWMLFCGALIFVFKLIGGPVRIAAETEAARSLTAFTNTDAESALLAHFNTNKKVNWFSFGFREVRTSTPQYHLNIVI